MLRKQEDFCSKEETLRLLKVQKQMRLPEYGKNTVLFLQNSFRKCLFGVVVEHWNRGLENGWSAINDFVDDMDGTPCNTYPVFQSLPLGVESGKGRQKRWVNIDDVVGIGREQGSGHDFHIPGKNDQVHSAASETGDPTIVNNIPLASKATSCDIYHQIGMAVY